MNDEFFELPSAAPPTLPSAAGPPSPDERRPAGPLLARIALIAAAAGLLDGLLQGAFAALLTPERRSAWLLLAQAGVALLPPLLVTLALWGALAAWRRLFPARAVRPPRPAFPARLTAALLAALPALLVAFALSRGLHGPLGRVTVESAGRVALGVSVLALGGLVLGLFVGGYVLLRGALRRWPRLAANVATLRDAALVLWALAGLALVLHVLRTFGNTPLLTLGGDVVIYAALAVLVVAGARLALPRRRAWRPRVYALAAGGLFAAGALCALLAFGLHPPTRGLVASQSTLAARLLRPLLVATEPGPPAAADPQAAADVLPRETYFGPVPGAPARPNILFVVVDAFRARNASFLGYKRAVTPDLERLAAEALVFERARSQAPGTRPSFPSFLTGRYATHLRWRRNGDTSTLLPENVTLAELLKANGYATGALVNAWFVRNLPGLDQGYDDFRALYPYERWADFTNRSAPLATASAIEYIVRHQAGPHSNRPFFLTVYYEDPHHKYAKHPLPDRSFGNRPVDLYDGELAFVDRHLGFLIDFIRQRPELWNNTVIIVAADHGEEFGEHGGQFHDTRLYEESLHVVLLARVPGLKPARIRTPVGLVSLFATVADLAGVREALPRVQGRSLFFPVLRGEDWTDRPLFAEVVHLGGPSHKPLQAVYRGKYKLIRDLTAGTDELYDLSADPGEKQNRAATDPQQVRALRRLLQAWQAGALLRE